MPSETRFQRLTDVSQRFSLYDQVSGLIRFFRIGRYVPYIPHIGGRI
jgi:hypothetical protein